MKSDTDYLKERLAVLQTLKIEYPVLLNKLENKIKECLKTASTTSVDREHYEVSDLINTIDNLEYDLEHHNMGLE